MCDIIGFNLKKQLIICSVLSNYELALHLKYIIYKGSLLIRLFEAS